MGAGKRTGKTANQITAELLIEIPKRFSNIRVWRNNRVEAMVTGRGGRLRRVSAGIDGQGDVTGIIRVEYGGRLFGVRYEGEIKTANDRQRLSQKSFQLMLENCGGLYSLVTDVDQGLKDIEEFLCQFQSIASDVK